MTDFSALETTLDEAPLFPVEAPDNRRTLSEATRQRRFLNLLRMFAPSLIVWHTPNAGRRNPMLARLAGICGGVADITIASGLIGPLTTAYCEFKGYDKRGRPGTLSQAQIDWGNLMWRAGHPVSCFFSPELAVEWVRGVMPGAFLGGGGI